MAGQSESVHSLQLTACWGQRGSEGQCFVSSQLWECLLHGDWQVPQTRDFVWGLFLVSLPTYQTPAASSPSAGRDRPPRAELPSAPFPPTASLPGWPGDGLPQPTVQRVGFQEHGHRMRREGGGHPLSGWAQRPEPFCRMGQTRWHQPGVKTCEQRKHAPHLNGRSASASRLLLMTFRPVGLCQRHQQNLHRGGRDASSGPLLGSWGRDPNTAFLLQVPGWARRKTPIVGGVL